MRKSITSRLELPTRTIGILGTGRGAGTTHLAFMAAVFLGSVMGRKTALVEAHDSGCFRQAEIILDYLNKKPDNLGLKISIFRYSAETDLSSFVDGRFEYVIADFGSDLHGNRPFFSMCNVKLTIGNMSAWKFQEYVAFLGQTEQERQGKHWVFLGTFPVREGPRYLRQHFGIHVRVVPYEPDPFVLGIDSQRFLAEIFRQII